MILIQELMREYEVEIDDIRWYLALQKSEELLLFRDTPDDLAKLIWKGSLEADIYRMDERFIDRLQERVEQNLVDEPELRKIFSEIVVARQKSRWT